MDSDCRIRPKRDQKHITIYNILQDLSLAIDDLDKLKDQLVSGNTPLNMSTCNKPHQEFKDPEKAQVEPAVESLVALLDRAPEIIAEYKSRITKITTMLRENLL